MIEGIGPEHGFFYSPGDCFEYGAVLKYFEQNNQFAYCDNCGADTTLWEGFFCHDFPLTINEINKTPISLFPNPNRGDFCLNFIGHLQIFNTLGTSVYQTTLTSKHQTLTPHLPAGIYFVRIKDGEKVYTQKLVIE
jgi:hypothetical protein